MLEWFTARESALPHMPAMNTKGTREGVVIGPVSLLPVRPDSHDPLIELLIVYFSSHRRFNSAILFALPLMS